MALTFEFREKKAIASISFLAAQKVPELTKGKIAKLLFLADKLHLVRYGRVITGDWYAALQHGPIPSNTDNLLDAFEAGRMDFPGVADLARLVCLDKSFQYPRILSQGESTLPEEQLSATDLETLKEVADGFGQKSFGELRALTHTIPAWEKAWETKTGQQGEMRFEDFFEEDENAVAGVREEALENSKLRAAFPEPVWE